MDVTLHSVEGKDKGWLITLQSQFQPDMNRKELMKMEDWEITIQGEQIYFKNYFDLSEPWEDEPLEEIIKAATLEVEWKLKRLLK
ncbi:hypothetical protein FGU46_00400 [Methanobacterium sp. CWC-01]|uniref:hypothetical protein n=1 Tax=Methanobacterium aridiramus TaxID=2584467 RepID=UPI0025749B93|nr:hypothetical protein [Methanobacterium sp. CWC-01]WJI08658.1 hypothetical protein FGU46_00400 [Methanobacterium sp. CWC-01]